MKYQNIISSTGLILAALFAIALIIFANTTFTSLRFDLTENKLFTLSDGTINILHSLEEPVTLDFYFSKKSMLGFPTFMNYGTRVRDFLEEYAAKSNGKIKLTIIEPEPFSEEEDQAVASGLQGVAVSAAGDRAYFGLVGTNAIDDEKIIPFFQPEREAALEYDLTKLIYNLANPDKRVIGIISSLPVFGIPIPQQQQGPWAIINALREFFEVRELGIDVDNIDKDIGVLMVIHPKDLSDTTHYAIDQFVLGGGRAMLFVDPLAETDDSRADPQNPMVLPDFDSDLKLLFDVWGLEIPEGKVTGDINAAMRVQTRSPRGPLDTIYLPWLRLDKKNLNKDDFSTNELDTINIGTAGMIKKTQESELELIPLIQTGTESMSLDRDQIILQNDPDVLLNSFVSDNEKKVLAARLSGRVKSAYPDGPPTSEDETIPGPDHLTEGDINIIVVADTDILSDMFWIRVQNFFGMQISQPIADNGDFIINSLDNLSGNTDLISLRSRGEFSRPFTRVESIRRSAENKFREREKQLQEKLEQTEQRIIELQKDTENQSLILSPEQSKEIEKFRMEQIKTRKELRAVQHELQKNIERLGTQLKFINIGLIPLLIILITIFSWLYRSKHRV